MNRSLVLGTVAASLALTAGPAGAHHSVAMFDRAKTVRISGTVKEFQYTNPHSWLHVVGKGEGPEAGLWSFETGGPPALMRAGIRKNSVAPGDNVVVVGNPLNDGRPGALLVCVAKSDGTILNPGSAARTSC